MTNESYILYYVQQNCDHARLFGKEHMCLCALLRKAVQEKLEEK